MPRLRVKRLSLLFSLLLAATIPVMAQSAMDFYHDAAQLYIAENNAEAEAAALAGLALAPDSQKIRALLDKIREQNDQHQQQNDEGEQQEQENSDDPQQGEGQQQDQNDAGDPQPGEEGEEGSEGNPSQQQQQEGPADEPPRDEREGNTGTEGEPSEGTPEEGGGGAESPYDVKPGEMSRAEAERILRAIQADELELLRDVQRRRARPRYVEKDW